MRQMAWLVAGLGYCLVAAAAAAQPVKAPGAGEVLTVAGRCEAVGGEVRVVFGPAGREGVALAVRCVDMPSLNHHWGLTKVDAELPDAALRLSMTGNHGWDAPRLQRVYFIRPDVHFYVGDDFNQAVGQWTDFPCASKHAFRLDLERRGERVETTLDGRYFGSFLMPAQETVDVVSKGGAEVDSVTTRATRETERYLPLDLTATNHSGKGRFRDASLNAGAQQVAGVPMEVLPATTDIDVGRSRWLQDRGGSSTFYDAYYKRSAWDGVPETIMFSVPRRFYTQAHLLCAVETEGGKSPSLSLRLARYRQRWDGGGGTQADSTVVIDPDEPVGCTSVRQVGSIAMARNGETHTLPVYLVAVPLKTGELADYLSMTNTSGGEAPDFFYLELTRELRTRVPANYSYYERKPLGPPSGVHVFGVTLEKAPVEIVVGSEVAGAVFYTDERPRLTIHARNPSPTPQLVHLQARLTDFFGKVHPVAQDLPLPAGATQVPFDLQYLPAGWYNASFTFSAGGKPFWEQPLTFALLPPDTRKAGEESPFGIWWFAGPHYCESDPNRVLPLVQKMGFRHVTAQDLNLEKGHTPEVWGQYQVTPSMMRRIKERADGPSVEAQAAKFLHDWPGTRFAMIFHETGGLPFGLAPPPELLGQAAPEFSGDDLAKEQELLDRIRRHASAIRKADPAAKILLGNSGTNFNVHWLRKKLPRELWDYLGMEMAVQLFAPESQPHGWNLQALWIAKRMCELYGYDDIPLASCYEFDYRATAPGALSLRDQANWYARDVLHCLAYGLPSINVALIHDVDSAYYFSRWGSTGVCGRAPWLLPKPSFVALATLSRVLDGAKYRRWLDTGSHSLYCLEFKQEGSFVYALWTATGGREVELALPAASRRCRLIDLMGRGEELTPVGGAIRLRATESPSFLVSPQPVARAVAGRARHAAPALDGTHVVDRLLASDWRIVEQEDERFRDYCPYKPQVKAECSLTAGSDGRARLTLHSQPEVPDLVARYTILEPKEGPIPLDGTPNMLGVWVNGNSNWGRIIFQVEDADGNEYTSVTFGDWDVSDWEATTSVNFDGWKRVDIALPRNYESGHPGPDMHRWSPMSEPTYPLRLTRLYVILREKLVYVTDMVPAKSRSIELKDLTAGTDPGRTPDAWRR